MHVTKGRYYLDMLSPPSVNVGGSGWVDPNHVDRASLYSVACSVATVARASLSHFQVQQHIVGMFTPRPASAGTMGRRSYDAFSYRHFGGGEQVQDALLHKIELLAARHARNVQALKLLRGNAPKNVWAKGTSLPTRHKITSPEREIKTFKENSNGKSTREARQVFAAPREDVRRRRWFTRVTTSPDSRWKHETTVVEPFRSMETHATAWKRKIRQQQEVL